MCVLLCFCASVCYALKFIREIASFRLLNFFSCSNGVGLALAWIFVYLLRPIDFESLAFILFRMCPLFLLIFCWDRKLLEREFNLCLKAECLTCFELVCNKFTLMFCISCVVTYSLQLFCLITRNLDKSDKFDCWSWHLCCSICKPLS